MVSAGVFIMERTAGAPTSPIIMIAIPAVMESAIAVCTASRTSHIRPPPKNWEIVTVAPVDTPTKNPTKILITMADAPPTSASASFPTNWPTTTASTVLYNC